MTNPRTGGAPYPPPPERHNCILIAIQSHIDTHGYPPTIREIAALTSLPQSTAYQCIKRLERQGYLTRQPGKPRSIALVGAAREPPKEA